MTRERFKASVLPWNVRFALAAHDAGWRIPNHLLMAVQMVRNGEGCASCRVGNPTQPLDTERPTL